MKKICDELQKAALLVASHKNPEGDAIGSTLAFYHTFPDKKVELFNADPVPYFLKFLPGVEKIRHQMNELSGEYDLVVIVDCANPDRVCERFFQQIKPKFTINIDHHESNSYFGDLNLIDPKASSTGELLFQLFSCFPQKINSQTATCLYTAIMMDTGSFRYINTTPRSLEIASKLANLGADPAWIARNVYESHPPARLILLGMALQTMVFSPDGKRAEMTLTKEMFQKAQADVSFSEGFINYLTSVAGVEVAVLFRELDKNTYKVSFRSQGRVNVAKLAEELGGGGHFQASGTTLKGSLDDIKKLVRQKVDELIAQSKNASQRSYSN